MKNKKKNVFLKIIQVILILIIIYCLVQIGLYYYGNYMNTKNLNEINKIVDEIKEEVLENKKEDTLNFTKEQLDNIAKKTIARLKQINNDVYAFIKADEFKISNPIVFKEKDNDYYLFKDLQGNWSRPGTLFLNGWNKTDFSDMNTTVFGHNLRTTAELYAPMFKLLLNLENKDFVDSKKEHIVEIYTEKEYKKYVIFSAYYTNEQDNYITPNMDKDSWKEFLDKIQAKSIQKFNLSHKISEKDKILTLSTCDNVTDEGRFVVHAYGVR